jgi:hypothetical protein
MKVTKESRKTTLKLTHQNILVRLSLDAALFY